MLWVIPGGLRGKNMSYRIRGKNMSYKISHLDNSYVSGFYIYNDEGLYLHKDGDMQIYCGKGGLWSTKEEALAFFKQVRPGQTIVDDCPESVTCTLSKSAAFYIYSAKGYLHRDGKWHQHTCSDKIYSMKISERPEISFKNWRAWPGYWSTEKQARRWFKRLCPNGTLVKDI
jgi:hypothetical protein